MTREDERTARIKQQRSKEAIDLAMQARWQEAVDVNKEIVKGYPDDVDAFNRMGRAYMELGRYKQAREAYENAVKLDPYNAIAGRNIRRLNDMKDTGAAEIETEKVEPQQFIEEIGKAGVVTLIELAQKEKRAHVVAGDKVVLKTSGSALMVESGRGEYLGRVELKHGQRIARLMNGGNKYSAVVVKSSADGMTVMIRETFQHPSQAGKLSFPPKGSEEFRAYGAAIKVNEEGEEEDSGYTIVGGEEVEVLSEQRETADENGNEEDI
ncbi:MAG TPA: tetratricopeptide repeat protein [Dehalococcoidales bacterium]|nr:tetratricopeptide repeat protein [Dehalococcoidales bacterium]